MDCGETFLGVGGICSKCLAGEPLAIEVDASEPEELVFYPDLALVDEPLAEVEVDTSEPEEPIFYAGLALLDGSPEDAI